MTKKKPYNKERERNRYLGLKAKGICTSCKTKKAAPGYVCCTECREKVKSRKDYESKRYAGLKARGICPSCKKRKAAPGRVQCEQCSVEVKECRRKLVSSGICRQCRNEEAEPGKQNCWDCAEKARKAGQARRDSETAGQRTIRLAYHRAYARMRSENFKAAGLCTRCGKRKSQSGKSVCIDCRIVLRREKEQRKPDTLLRNERPDYGLCYICGEAKLDGKKLCARCVKTSMLNLEKANAAIDREGHPWHALNSLTFAKPNGAKGGTERGQECTS